MYSQKMTHGFLFSLIFANALACGGETNTEVIEDRSPENRQGSENEINTAAIEDRSPENRQGTEIETNTAAIEDRSPENRQGTEIETNTAAIEDRSPENRQGSENESPIAGEETLLPSEGSQEQGLAIQALVVEDKGLVGQRPSVSKAQKRRKAKAAFKDPCAGQDDPFCCL